MLAEDFEDELTCPVCLMLFVDPRTLPCGNSHNVCLDCARGLWRNPTTTGYGNNIQCPVCRATCNLAGGVDRLPLNLALKNMVEKLEHAQKNKGGNSRKAFPPKRKLKCDVCEKKPAQMECVTCVVKYCEACLETCHPKDRAVFKAHVVVPMELVSTRECELHKSQALSFFCTQCGVAVCAHCLLMGAHIDHSRVSLQHAVKEKKASLLEAIETLKGNRSVVLDFSGKTERALQTIQHQCRELRTSVAGECVELQTALEHLERKLLDAIDGHEKERKDGLEQMVEAQRQKLSLWNSMLERAEQLAQEEDGAIFLDIETLKLERRLRAAVDAASVPPAPPGGTGLGVELTLNMAPLHESVAALHFTELLVPAPPTDLTVLPGHGPGGAGGGPAAAGGSGSSSSIGPAAGGGSGTVSVGGGGSGGGGGGGAAVLMWRWEARRDAPAGGFVVERAVVREGGEEWEEIYHGAARTCSAGDLCPTSAYRFRVSAVNSSGRSGWSSEAVFCPAPPLPPPDLQVLETSDRSLLLAWPGDPTRRTHHCRFSLEARLADTPSPPGPTRTSIGGGGGSAAAVSGPLGGGGGGDDVAAGAGGPAGADGEWVEVYSGPGRTCVVEGLQPARAYLFRVSAVTAAGRSGYGPMRRVVTLAGSPGGAPLLSRAAAAAGPFPAAGPGASVMGGVGGLIGRGLGQGVGDEDDMVSWIADELYPAPDRQEGNGQGMDGAGMGGFGAEESTNAPAEDGAADGAGENAVGSHGAA